MKNKDLGSLLKDNLKFSEFLSKNLGIEDNFKIIKSKVLNYIPAMAYSAGYNQIGISNETKRIMYFISKKEELKELREGCKFIIYHELGHSHDTNYRNKNVRDYFNRLLYVSKDNDIIEAFPESEATRYAISKSDNYVDALAGFLAISSFLYRNKIENTIYGFSEYFSNVRIKREDKRKLVNSMSDFRLSKENYEKLTEKADNYLNKLNKNFARSRLYWVKERN
jgi:hypothetical protein